MGIDNKRATERQRNSIYGKYGSYGNKGLITFQSKINRELADQFEIIMRKEGKSRRQMLEEFIEWCKYEHANKKGLLEFEEE